MNDWRHFDDVTSDGKLLIKNPHEAHVYRNKLHGTFTIPHISVVYLISDGSLTRFVLSVSSL